MWLRKRIYESYYKYYTIKLSSKHTKDKEQYHFWLAKWYQAVYKKYFQKFSDDIRENARQNALLKLQWEGARIWKSRKL